MNFWERMLDQTLSRMIKDGTLVVTYYSGATKTYGTNTRLEANMRLMDDKIARGLCLTSEMALGEGYVDGQIETDDLFAMQSILLMNKGMDNLPLPARILFQIQFAARRVIQANTPLSARKNAAHHYDLTDELFALFLDEDRQYTCAYYAEPGMTLAQAQIAKRHHIAKKLLIKPGMRVLDIGCGWGGMGRTLARDYGAKVTGITLSVNQAAYANERAKAEGLDAEYRLLDYRKMNEAFDRIVTVGMLEHVGLPQFKNYFGQVKKLLNPQGIALTHCVMRNTPPSLPSGWLVKYVFPGGYAPALSEVMPVMEKTGLKITDMEIWRGHYAKTLHDWAQNTKDNAKRIIEMYDERFLRMWLYYLEGAEAIFYYGDQCNFQLQMAHSMYDVPVTRDYMHNPADQRMTKAPF